MAQAKEVMYHDDPPCYARLNASGFCPKCRVKPDMQSTALYPHCPFCDCRLKNSRCPSCGQTFETRPQMTEIDKKDIVFPCNEHIDLLQKRLANVPLSHFAVSDFSALSRLTGVSGKLPSEEDLERLEKIADDAKHELGLPPQTL